MERTNTPIHVALVGTNTVCRQGLYAILEQLPLPVSISLWEGLSSYLSTPHEPADLLLLDPPAYFQYQESGLVEHPKLLVLLESAPLPQQQTTNYLCCSWPLEKIQEQLSTLLQELKGTAPTSPDDRKLSHREEDILRAVAQGYTSKEIAEKLGISTNTVLSHRKNIATKLQIKTVSGLTFYALVNGIVTPTEMDKGE